LLFDSEVTEFFGDESLACARIADNKAGATDVLNIDAALVRIGVQPNTELLNGALALDRRGYITVDHECETSAPDVFAVGDVANPVSPTVSTAVGMAATAAKKIYPLLNHKKPL